VASRKTTPTSGTAKKHPAKTRPASKAETTSSKAKPVILDPIKPSKPAAKKVNRIETVEATVVAVKQPTPNASESPKTAKKAPDNPKNTPPQQPKAQAKTRPVLMFSGLVLGGLIAGAIGYGSAIITAKSPKIIRSDPAPVSTEIQSRLDQIESRILALETPETSGDLDKLRASLEALQSTLQSDNNALSKRLLETEAKLNDVVLAPENPTKTSGDATANLTANYRSEIDQIKAQIADQSRKSAVLSTRLDAVSKQAGAELSAAKTKIETLSKTTEKAVQSLDLGVTTERLRAAIETGRPFGNLLATLATETKITIPAALQINGQNGVATLSQLQKDFPEAARQALKSSVRANAENGLGSRIAAYVKSQVGVRSLEEKAGDGPDAVLSQAEASLGRGQLAQAIELVRSLPPEGVAKMNGWLTSANTSLAVRAALIQFEKSVKNKN